LRLPCPGTCLRRAALAWNLNWTDLKQLIRNSLEFAFLPPDEKAHLKADLEQRLKDFEQAER
jgi:adenosine deaminase